LIAGLDRPDAGAIVVDGVDLAALSDDDLTKLRRSRIGFVFQAFHVLPYLNVEQNVALPLTLNGVPSAEAHTTTQAMLEAVGLGDRGRSMPRELSGGELQRVAIARALIHRPGLVLADEPTGNLDPDNAGQVLALLRAQVKTNNAAGIWSPTRSPPRKLPTASICLRLLASRPLQASCLTDLTASLC
jgi:putative ABC transport system ATP-binding protein